MCREVRGRVCQDREDQSIVRPCCALGQSPCYALEPRGVSLPDERSIGIEAQSPREVMGGMEGALSATGCSGGTRWDGGFPKALKDGGGSFGKEEVFPSTR